MTLTLMNEQKVETLREVLVGFNIGLEAIPEMGGIRHQWRCIFALPDKKTKEKFLAAWSKKTVVQL